MCLSAQQQSPAQDRESLTVEQIVQRLIERNRQRAEALKAYTSTRTYHLLYTGFPGKREAEMTVEARFEAPNAKRFKVISQSGSSSIINRVFKKLLESEQEASEDENRARTALNGENYSFELVGRETKEGRDLYVLRAIPKVSNKFLYRGTIWVDAEDFAVVQIEAQPAKKPSFWISKTNVRHRYAKFGDFWLPSENHSTTDVRIGGAAKLTITYTGYKISSATASTGVGGLSAEPTQ